MNSALTGWSGAAWTGSVLAAALAVAAAIHRPAPDFAARPVLALLHSPGGNPAWRLRWSRTAAEIAARSLGSAKPPRGHAFELWLVTGGSAAPRPLGILPLTGRRLIPLAPANVRLLGGPGALIATAEPPEGTPALRPSGPALFRGRLRAPIEGRPGRAGGA